MLEKIKMTYQGDQSLILRAMLGFSHTTAQQVTGRSWDLPLTKLLTV
jgi:hypothetical protein